MYPNDNLVLGFEELDVSIPHVPVVDPAINGVAAMTELHSLIDAYLRDGAIPTADPRGRAPDSGQDDWLARLGRSAELQERWEWAGNHLTLAPVTSKQRFTVSEASFETDDQVKFAKDETFYYVYRMVREAGFSREQALTVTSRWFVAELAPGFSMPPVFFQGPPTVVDRNAIIEAVLDTKADSSLLDLERQSRKKNNLLAEMRVILFLMIARGQLADAHPPVNATLYLPSVEKAAALGGVVVRSLDSLVLLFFQFLTISVSIVSSLGRWYSTMPLEQQCLIDLIMWGFIIYVAKSTTHREQPTIIVRKQMQPNSFIGTRTTDSGQTVYDVMIDGTRYALPAVVSSEIEHVEEMSMPGSDYHPSSKRPVGAVLVSTADTDLQVFGVFWRHNDYFITARHVANALSSGTAKVFLASTKENAKKNFTVGNVVSANFSFDMDSNLVRDLTLDVFVVRLSPAMWATIGLPSASTRLRSVYKQHVSAVGFADKGLLVTSTGTTKIESGPTELWHTASTRKGFSGSPLFCGSSVVGMHVGGSSARNVAIRIEVILDALRYQNESNQPEEYGFRSDRKFNGRSARLERLHDDRYAVITSDGAVSYGWEEDEVKERFASMWDLDEKDQDRYQDRYIEKNFRVYNDERADLPTDCESTVNPEMVVEKCYTRMPREKPGRGPSSPKPDPLVCGWLDEEKDTLSKLGYQPGQMAYPEMTAQVELKSLEKHLTVFHNRAEMVTKPPTAPEVSRVVSLVAKLMAANRYEPDPAYKSKSFLEMLIHSSVCKPGKSSGYPHCSNGLPNNEAVIRQYGVSGLAQMVLNEWENEFQLKTFIKGEPTPIEKLLEGMPRIIVGLPVHKLLKHAAIFKNFTDALSANWQLSPVKFGFVPGNPGNMENLAKWLGKGELVESDKSKWDYMFQAWCFEVCEKVTIELASKPLGMEDEAFEEYLADISQAFGEVYKSSLYRSSDGTVLRPTHDGVMKSGWFMTIAINSMAQIVLNTLLLMRLGYSDDQILNDFKIVAGGDDVLQKLPGVDLEAYKAESACLGMPIKSLIIRPDITEFEFFSTLIKFRKIEGTWSYKPIRFTKHIEHLRHVTLEDLPQALVSQMGNWRWSDPHFRFFERMYKSFRLQRPDLFELRLLISMRAWRNKQLGYEGGDW